MKRGSRPPKTLLLLTVLLCACTEKQDPTTPPEATPTHTKSAPQPKAKPQPRAKAKPQPVPKLKTGFEGKSLEFWESELLSKHRARRSSAFRAFRSMGASAAPAAPRLLKIYLSEDRDRAQAAENGLVLIGEPAIPTLCGAFAGADARQSEKIVLTLNSMASKLKEKPNEQILQTLNRAVAHENAMTRELAVSGLRQWGPAALKALPTMLAVASSGKAGRQWWLCVREMGPGAIPELIKFMGEIKCRDLCKQLGTMGEPAVKPLLKVLSTHKDGWVRGDAANYLGTIAYETRSNRDVVGAALIRALRDSSSNVRVFAVLNLGSLKTRAAVLPMANLLDAAKANEAQRVAQALTKIGAPAAAPAIPKLLARLEASRTRNEVHVVNDIVHTLGRIGKGSKPVLEAMEELATNGTPQFVREQAEGALLRLRR